MRAVRLIFVLAVLGAVLSAGSMLLYQLYILDRSGQLGHVSVRALLSDSAVLLDVMRLHVYALRGALIGALLGVLWLLLVALFRVLKFGGRERSPRPVRNDPDRVIKDMRTRRAEEYLARRKAERGGMRGR